MHSGEKIVITRVTNGWVVQTDLRVQEPGVSRDEVLVATTEAEALELVRQRMLAAEPSARQQ
jgi:hypothetical protein